MCRFGGPAVDRNKTGIAKLLSDRATRAQTADFEKEVNAHKDGYGEGETRGHGATWMRSGRLSDLTGNYTANAKRLRAPVCPCPPRFSERLGEDFQKLAFALFGGLCFRISGGLDNSFRLEV